MNILYAFFGLVAFSSITFFGLAVKEDDRHNSNAQYYLNKKVKIDDTDITFVVRQRDGRFLKGFYQDKTGKLQEVSILYKDVKEVNTYEKRHY